VSATGRSPVRLVQDVYPTPGYCVDKLLPWLDLNGRDGEPLTFFEPCRGDGAIYDRQFVSPIVPTAVALPQSALSEAFPNGIETTFQVVSILTGSASSHRATIGTGLSALWAFRSADSARAAQRSADEAARRNALLTIARTAADVLAELQRVESRSKEATRGYDTLLVFSGSYEHTGIDEAKTKVSSLQARAQERAEYAKLWTDPGAKLRDTPPEEIDRVQLKLTAILSEIAAVREELDRTVASVEAQNAPYRQRALSKGTGRTN
jgi:hypothetical protein